MSVDRHGDSRWDRLWEIFHAVRETEPANRPAILDELCGTDAQLRAEVQELLDAASSPLDRNPVGFLESADQRSSPLHSGTLLCGRFEIVRLIGQGGMGSVYEALDRSLGSRVALKTLLPGAANDERARRRFYREIDLARKVTHPNVCRLFDLFEHRGESGGEIAFVTMELLEGETLAARLAQGPFSSEDALPVARQIAAALEAAHASGIVHRDLKPGNVVLTGQNGQSRVVVTDFGLARRSSGGPDEGAHVTDSGQLFGTPGYMAPEQLLENEITPATDIYAFGLILYEMITGSRPFPSESPISAAMKRLHGPVPSPKKIAPGIDDAWNWTILHCLEPDPRKRFQSASQVIDSLAGKSPFRLKRQLKLTAAILLAVFGVLAFALWLRSERMSSSDPIPARLDIQRVTSLGNVTEAAISPDGKYQCYVVSDENMQSLWLQQLGTAEAVQIRAPERMVYFGHRFSPDGRFIYYIAKEQVDSPGKLFRIATLGGTPDLLLTGIDSNITFSPDGSKIAYFRADYPTPPESALVISNADGTGPKVIATRREPSFFVPTFFNAPSWSPEGEWIACSIRHSRGDLHAEIVAIRSDGSQEKRLSDNRWAFAGQLQWLPDGRGLLAIASDTPPLREGQVWLLPWPSGEPQRITRDLLRYRSISLTRDGRTMLTVAMDTNSEIWIAPLSSPERVERLTTLKNDADFGLAATSDGRIVFVSDLSGRPQLWIANRDGSARKPLLPGYEQPTRLPAVAPSGEVVFLTRDPRGQTLAAVRLDGSGLRLLTPVAVESTPTFTPDGRFMIYTNQSRGLGVLFKIPMAGGSAEKLTDYPAHSAAVSPDGKWIAAGCSTTDGPLELCVIPIEGGPPVNRFPLDRPAYFDVEWSPDGKELFFIGLASDAGNVYVQPLSGAPRHRVTNFETPLIVSLAAADQGQSLVVNRGNLSRDAVLITGFQ